MPRLLAGLVLCASLALGLPVQAGGGGVARKPVAKPIRLLHPSPSPKGTILMFHGFSSGPSQWSGEARHRYKEGYDVIVAALPGHGFVDKAGREDLSRLPTASQADRYTKFARAMFDQARARSGKVHVVGFSVGGAHALEVALANRELRGKDGEAVVRSVVAVNPYLSPSKRKILGIPYDPDAVVRVADKMTFGLVRKLLPKREYLFDGAIRKQRAGEPDVGFTRTHLGQVFAIGRFGDQVEARAKAVSKTGGLGRPAFIVISEKDPTADPKSGLRLADQIGAEKLVLPTDKHNPFHWSTANEPAEMKLRAEVHGTISKALRAGAAMEP